MDLDYKSLVTDDSETLVWQANPGHQSTAPVIVWLGGFRSNMSGIKATRLAEHCLQQGWPFLRFDYRGHGQSSGRFADGTLSLWIKDTLTVIEHAPVANGRAVVLIGSSMGAWIMAHVGLMLGHRLVGMLGIASAPDFSEELLWQKFTPAQQRQLLDAGEIHIPSNYDDGDFTIALDLIKDGRDRLILNHPIPLGCPVRLIHGQADVDVPFDFSLRFAQSLASPDIVVELVKSADHRLSTDDDINRIHRLLNDLIRTVTRLSDTT